MQPYPTKSHSDFLVTTERPIAIIHKTSTKKKKISPEIFFFIFNDYLVYPQISIFVEIKNKIGIKSTVMPYVTVKAISQLFIFWQVSSLKRYSFL